MADLNTTYTGTIDVQDPDRVIFQTHGFFPWDPPVDHFLPDEVRDAIRKTNADAVSTVNAVKVPYTGTTQSERTAWINDRLTAINNRVSFIKTRTDTILSAIESAQNDSYNALVKVVTSALSLVPVVGSAVSFVTNQANTAQAVDLLKTQQLIQAYSGDLGQLAEIRAQLTKELSKSDSISDPTSNAPTVSTWYWLAGAGLLLLLLIWLRKRAKRRKR